MLRQIVTKKTAGTTVTVLVTLCLMALFWPLGRFHEITTFDPGQEIALVSDPITPDEDAGQYFIPHLTRLDALSVYVDSAEPDGKAPAALMQLYRQEEAGNFTLLAQENVPLPDELPGYLTFPVDTPVEPGTTYVCILRAADSSFRVGFTAAPASSGPSADSGAPEYVLAFHNDTGISGVTLAVRGTYKEPLSAGKVLLAVLILTAAGGIAAALWRRYYHMHPERNTYVTVLSVLQAVLTPILAAGGAAAFLAVWPAKLFDSRIPDILMYETGIVLAVCAGLYALWHKRIRTPDGIRGMRLPHGFRDAVIMVLVCAGLAFCSRYINALNDYDHKINESYLLIVLSLLILALGRMAWSLNAVTMLWTGASLIWAAVHAAGNRVPEEAKDALLQNRMTLAQSLSVVFVGLALLSCFMMAAELAKLPRALRKPQDKTKITPAVLPFGAMLLWMLVFRNTRAWIGWLVLMTGLLLFRFAFYDGKRTWIRDVCSGVVLNFIGMMLYSMLHRYYIAYVFNRFAMSFFTVTVTAYYLLIVACAALALLVMKLEQTRGLAFRERLPHIFPECLLFGAVSSYMLMSLTRAGVYGLAALCIVSAILGTAGKGRRITGPVKTLLAYAGITVLTFPMIFTGQRLISTAYERPVRYELVETYPDALMRHVPWNSTAFMNVEIFLRDFGDRILGGEIGTSVYQHFDWGRRQGYKTSSAAPVLVAKRTQEASLSAVPGAFLQQALPQSLTPSLLYAEIGHIGGNDDARENKDDVSNGRLALWEAYAAECSMTGHDAMGLTMPDGTVTVHAHNIFLQTAYDNGIPAGILLGVCVISWILAALRYYLRYRTRETAAMFPLLIAGGFLSTGMVEWIFHLCNPFTFILFLCLLPLMFRQEAAQ